MSSHVNSILDNIIEKGSNLTEQAIHKAQELGEVVQDHIEVISEKVTSNEHVQDAMNKANEIKDNVQDGIEVAKDKAMENEHVANIVQKSQDAVETVKDKFEGSEYTPESIDIDQVNAILGKTVGDITILNSEEQVLAFPGEVVTQELIESARANKVLDVLIANVQ